MQKEAVTMKGKILLAVLLAAAVLGIAACSEEGNEGSVAAVYNGQKIMMSSVEQQKETAGEQRSNREIVDNIIKNMIMAEEAAKRGLTATKEEIDEFLDSTVYASYKILEGKQEIDEYCASAGLTFEEYVETVREQAPRIIEKAKLERAVAQEYCQKHNIELDELNPPQEVRDAIEDFCTDLLEAHRDDITYYVK